MGVLVKVAGTIAKVLEGIVTCDIVLTNRCSGGSVDIWLMCNGKGVGSDTTMDGGPWCKCISLVENQSEKSSPKVIGQSRFLQTMNCCWNVLGNSRLQVVVPRGLRLLPLATLSLSKHAYDIQEMVVPVSNKDIILLLLIVTRKFVA